jgi:hypothetical protein
LAIVGAVVLTGVAAGCGGPTGPSKVAYVKRVDGTCGSPHTRRALGAGLRELASLPRGLYARTHALRSASRALATPVHRLTAKVRGLPAPAGDQPVLDRWLDDLHKLAALTKQAAATERRIISLEAHHPGVVERSGTVRNADLDRALEAKLAAARTARTYGLEGCARTLGRP